MSSILFRGAVVDSVKFWAGDGGKTAELDMIADWSEPVCEAMEWGEPATGFCKSDLSGELHGINLIITPNKTELKSYELDIKITKVSNFKYVPKLDKEGNVKSRELHFKIFSGMEGVGGLLEGYLEHLGDAPARLKVVLQEEAQQELPGTVPEKTRGRRKAEAVQ